jgi:fatty-acyl-CoA synthase
MFTVPTIVKMLVDDPAVDRFDHAALRFVIYAGAPMYRADQKQALQKLGPVLVQYFGLGEVTGNITVVRLICTIETARRPASAPAASSARAWSRSGDDGRELKPFETGEICVSVRHVRRLLRQSEANAKAFRDSWFYRRSRPHGRRRICLITGRASDMYISGGSNIYPREVEEEILTHPAIGEVAIVGVPDPVWGEVGIAVCVAREGASAVTELELATFLAPKVPRYKMPKRFFFWESLPKSGYGKIPKRLVRRAGARVA